MAVRTSDSYLKLLCAILLLTKDKGLNRTQLNKLLFFADAAYYVFENNNGQRNSVTGQKYYKRFYGPVPAEIDKARIELTKNELLEEIISDNGNVREYTYYAITDNINFDTINNKLSKEDKHYLKITAEQLSHFSATYLSDESHKLEPWKTGIYDKILDFSKMGDSSSEFAQWLRKHGINQFERINSNS